MDMYKVVGLFIKIIQTCIMALPYSKSLRLKARIRLLRRTDAFIFFANKIIPVLAILYIGLMPILCGALITLNWSMSVQLFLETGSFYGALALFLLSACLSVGFCWLLYKLRLRLDKVYRYTLTIRL